MESFLGTFPMPDPLSARRSTPFRLAVEFGGAHSGGEAEGCEGCSFVHFNCAELKT